MKARGEVQLDRDVSNVLKAGEECGMAYAYFVFSSLSKTYIYPEDIPGIMGELAFRFAKAAEEGIHLAEDYDVNSLRNVPLPVEGTVLETSQLILMSVVRKDEAEEWVARSTVRDLTVSQAQLVAMILLEVAVCMRVTS